MNEIESDRFVLRLVPLAALASTAAADVHATRKLVGEHLPQEWFTDAWVYQLRHDQWVADASYAPWSVRVISAKETGDIVGNINCHHKPMPFILDGQEFLAVEIGYTIFEDWRRQGIALEAVLAFADWARTEGVACIVLSISPDNVPSLGLAEKLGARKIGSQIDELDGPEDIYLFKC